MSLPYAVVVEGLVAVGVPRDRAEERARLECGIPAPLAERDAAVDEKREQVEVRKRFVVCGFAVYTLSQARASKQTPGLPDLWFVHRDRPIATWWEVKRQIGGRFSEAQIAFRIQCERCGVGYGAGDRHAAAAWLVEHGLATLAGGVLEPVRSEGAARSPALEPTT